jgi:hypothetical protein
MGTGHHAAVSAGVKPGSLVAVVGDGAVGLSGALAAMRLEPEIGHREPPGVRRARCNAGSSGIVGMPGGVVVATWRGLGSDACVARQRCHRGVSRVSKQVTVLAPASAACVSAEWRSWCRVQPPVAASNSSATRRYESRTWPLLGSTSARASGTRARRSVRNTEPLWRPSSSRGSSRAVPVRHTMTSTVPPLRPHSGLAVRRSRSSTSRARTSSPALRSHTAFATGSPPGARCRRSSAARRSHGATVRVSGRAHDVAGGAGGSGPHRAGPAAASRRSPSAGRRGCD